MPATDLHSRLSLLSIHRHVDPVPAADPDPFQLLAARRLHALLASPHPALSSPWLHALLDAALLLHADLHALLDAHPRPLPAALRRALSESLDRSLRSLDLLSSARDSLLLLQRSASLADLAASALPRRALSDSNLHRTRRALADLSPDPSPAPRHRSFGGSISRRSHLGDDSHRRSLSWGVPFHRSAARQLQAFAATVSAPPRGADPLVAAAYTSDCVLLLAARILTAAVSRDGAAPPIHQTAPRGLAWAAAAAAVQERAEEALRERGTGGLLVEARAVEEAARGLKDAIGIAAPRGTEWEAEVRSKAVALAAAAGELRDASEMLEEKVMDVFRAIAGSRSRRLDDGLLLDQTF